MSRNEIAQQFNQKADTYFDEFYKSSPKNCQPREKTERARITKTWLKRYLQQDTANILDAGCGTGNVLVELIQCNNSWRGFGIDISPRMIQNASQLTQGLGLGKRLEFQVMSIEGIDDSYEAVVSLGVIGYQQDQIQFLDSLAKAVKPGGILIFSFGNRDSIIRIVRNLLVMFRNIFSHRTTLIPFRDIRFKTIDECLSNHGFKNEEIEFLNFGLLNGEKLKTMAKCLDNIFGQNSASRFLSLTGVVFYKKDKER